MSRTGFTAWITLLAVIRLSLGVPYATGAEPAPSPAPTPRTAKPRTPAKPRLGKDEVLIPSRPTAPPLLAPKSRPETFNCARSFVYRGNQLECDSNLARDAENLRPIVEGVPSAVSELNDYQRNRRNVRTLAYVGTLGLLLITTGLILGRAKEGSEGVALRNLMVGSGLLVTTASLSIGLAILESNESNLNRTVENYNRAKPDDAITLKFSTEVSF